MINKEAAGYGVPRYGVQQYIPVMDKRKLTPKEEKSIEEGQSKWIPNIFQSHADPIPVKMTSPTKSAILTAVALGIVGAAGGFAAGSKFGGTTAESAMTAGISGLSLGTLGAILGYNQAKTNNATLRDYMERLPENATLRDLKSDPVYQQDIERLAMLTRAGMLSGAIAGR